MADKPNRTYSLLSNEAKIEVRKQLCNCEYFYHFTLSRNLKSIRISGLDPAFESDDSKYANYKECEPGPAVRFCTLNPEGLNSGLSAALARARVWRDGIMVAGCVPIAVLRAKSRSLLDRDFGLDHSFGNLAKDAGPPSPGFLSAEKFISLVRKYGVISAYQSLPPTELELCTSDGRRFAAERLGNFRSLLSTPSNK
jgi:hypothetical protein